MNAEAQAEFGATKLSALPQTCQSCDVCVLCNGGCPKDRDGSGLNRLYAGYQTFFHLIDRPMRTLAALQQQRSPAEIMRMDRTERANQYNKLKMD